MKKISIILSTVALSSTIIMAPNILNGAKVYAENSTAPSPKSGTIASEKEEIAANKNEQIETETTVTDQITSLIQKSNFSDLISIFSDSLFDDIPKEAEDAGTKYEITDLEKSYNEQIKAYAQEIAKLLVSQNGYTSFNEKKVKQQLILLNYCMRWGTFSDGSTLWKELYTSESTLFTKEEVKLLNDQFIKLFQDDPKMYLASKNVNKTFETVLKATGKNLNYKQTVEQFLSKKKGVSDYSAWFYKMFPGKMYKDHYQGTKYDVGIWNRGEFFDEKLPYLLTQSRSSNLVIGESRNEIFYTSTVNYNNDQEKTKQAINGVMKTITNILELYDRTIEDKTKMNVDSLMGLEGVFDRGKKWLDNTNSLSVIYRLSGNSQAFSKGGAFAGGRWIQLQTYDFNNWGVIAHELHHNLTLLFGPGMNEYFTTYINNVGREKAAYVNIFADGKTTFANNDMVSNSSTSNFKTKADLVNYAKNMEDTAYLLDGMVAKKVLSLPIEEQAKYIKIAYVNGETGALNTKIANSDTVQVKDLTVKELKSLNIKTLNDLIDHDAVIMQPDDSNKNILRNHGQGYGTTLTYSAYFLTNGKIYEHNHRIINTLLAKDGWEGFRNFNDTYQEVVNTNWKQGSDVDEINGMGSLAALRKVYKDDKLTYRQLVKNRYQEVMNKAQNKGLLDESYTELYNDFSLSQLNSFYNLKQKKMADYLSLSNEFSDSIFGQKSNLFQNVTSYTEFYEAIKNNPSARISIVKDILVDGVDKDKALPEFHGVLNGNGHKILNSKHSLFESLVGSEVKNLVIAGTSATLNSGENLGGLANSSQNTSVRNVHVINSTLVTKNEGDANVGGIIGNATDSQISDSSVQQTKVSGSYVGGIIGIASNTGVANVYSTGEVSNSRSGNLRIGGIVGNAFKNSFVTNAYTTMEVQGGNGILGSDYAYGNKETTIANVLSVANILTTGSFKVYGSATPKAWANNYEVTENSGTTSSGFESLDVKSISENEINSEFFKSKIKFGSDPIWDLSKTRSKDSLPCLKNDDPRYIPDPVKGKAVFVYYQDEAGKTISQTITLEGNIGGDYSSKQKAIAGYTFLKVQGNVKGKFSNQEQTVKYIYKKNTTPVPVTYHNIYRLYNKNTGEHFYTASAFERDNLIKGGWNNEGKGWTAPSKGTAVYRVYNPNAKGGDHYYTASKYEAESLVKTGWKWDNKGKPVFYSGGKTPIYVAFNPNATASGSHNYTSSIFEQKSLLNNGWKFGKIQFYGK